MAHSDAERKKAKKTVQLGLRWIEIPLDRFMHYASEIRVTWLGRFDSTDTRFRETTIDSSGIWKSFASICILPWYKNGLDWSYPNSKHYSLEEYARDHKEYELDVLPGKPLLTAFHSLLDVRLIVDACHRSVAIQNAVNAYEKIPRIRVLECYGTQLHTIFPCDFANLITSRVPKEKL